MAIDFCALCNDPCTGANASIGNNNMQELWRTLVAQALCGLVNAPVNAQTAQAEANSGTLAFGSVVSASYTNLIVNTEEAKALAITNGTDKVISVSADSTTNLIYVPAGASVLLNLAELGLHINSTVSVKAVTADATSGSVLGSLIYG